MIYATIIRQKQNVENLPPIALRNHTILNNGITQYQVSFRTAISLHKKNQRNVYSCLIHWIYVKSSLSYNLMHEIRCTEIHVIHHTLEFTTERTSEQLMDSTNCKNNWNNGMVKIQHNQSRISFETRYHFEGMQTRLLLTSGNIYVVLSLWFKSYQIKWNI